MPEITPDSALAPALAPRIVGPKGAETPSVRLAEIVPAALWQVAAWPDHMEEAGSAVAAAAGIDAAPGPGRASASGSTRALRTEPLKWLIVSDGPMAAPAVDAAHATLLDLGHARALLTVSGPRAEDLMARLFPVDTRAAAFPPGSVATSGLHHIGVLIERRDDGFLLFMPRSFALSLTEHVIEVAAQFTVEIA